MSSEIEDAFITAFVTLFFGLVLFVLTQTFLKLILEPVQELKKAIAEAHEEIIFSSNLYSNPMWSHREVTDEERKNYIEAKNRLRRISSKIRGQVAAIPAYESTSFIFRLPQSKSIESACSGLIYLHNSMTRHKEEKNWVENIHKAELQVATGLKRTKE